MITIIGGDGKPYGPVALDQVRRWIADGRASLDTQARREGETEWRRLGSFPEFAPQPPAAPSAPPPYAPPQAPQMPPSPPQPAYQQPSYQQQYPNPQYAAAPYQAAAPATHEQLASRLSRLLAQLIDSAIGLLVALPGLGLMGASVAVGSMNSPNMPLMISGAAVLILLLMILMVIQVIMLSTRGQSIGKRMLKIKIIRYSNGEEAGFVHAFLMRGFLMGVITGIIGIIPFVGPVFSNILSLVDVCMIFGAEQRCLHDLIADTKVIKLKS